MIWSNDDNEWHGKGKGKGVFFLLFNATVHGRISPIGDFRVSIFPIFVVEAHILVHVFVALL